MSETTEQLPYLTQGEQGIGGRIKERPEDFLVEEQPLYDPSGAGDHLYLWVEKTRKLTTEVARELARHFNRPAGSVGYAGLKDKHAVTRQMFSIEHADADRVPRFQDKFIKILWADRHANKIKRGHLAGNKFVIKVRDVSPTAVLVAKRVLDRLAREGAPNYAGEQRFGYRANNHILGKWLILGRLKEFLDELLGGYSAHEPPLLAQARHAYMQGDYAGAAAMWPPVHRFERQAIGPLARGQPPERAVGAVDHAQLDFLISAFQSDIFNQVLRHRVHQGLLHKLLPGDVAMKHDSNGMFLVEDTAAEQPRCDAFQISPTGPMWGRHMLRAAGQVDQWEREALAASGIDDAALESSPRRVNGTRRPLRMIVSDPDIGGGVDEHGAYVQVGFTLPRGSFATIVMREIMKPSPPPAGEAPATAIEVKEEE